MVDVKTLSSTLMAPWAYLKSPFLGGGGISGKHYRGFLRYTSRKELQSDGFLHMVNIKGLFFRFIQFQAQLREQSKNRTFAF